ncbi:MAG: hypothetical protein RR662_03920, partial [Clostridia bacterium]
NGGSKLRGSKAGGVQAMKSWKTIVLTTGEEPLSTMTTQTGVSTRALEIYGSPFKGEAEARKMHDIALENYGVAGPIFIDKLLNEYEKEFSKLKEMQKDIQETLSSEAENKVLSHISSVAVVVLADILMNRYIYGIDTTEPSLEMGRNILTLLHTVKEIDIVEKAYEYMQSWILSNDGFFVRDDAYQNSADFLSVYGLKDGDTYYVFPNIFNTALEKAKFNPMKVLKGFVEKGYLETEGTGFQRQKRFRCKRTRFIAFKINAEVDLEAEDLPF